MRQQWDDDIFDTQSQRASPSCSGRACFVTVPEEQRIKIWIGTAYKHSRDRFGEGNPVNFSTIYDATAKALLDLVGNVSPKVRESHAFRPQKTASELPAQADHHCNKTFDLMSIRKTLDARIGEIYHEVLT